MSYTKKKMAMKVDKNSLAFSFFSKMDEDPGDRKNIDSANKTKANTWIDQLLNYWQKVIEQTSSSMELIKGERLRMNLPIDDKFKEDFMHSANTIIGYTVEQFVIATPFNDTNLVTAHDEISEMSAKIGIGHGNHLDYEQTHHQSQNAAAHCLTEMILSPEPLFKTPGREKVKLEIIDEALPKVKTELNISTEPLNITLPKAKRVRASAVSVKPKLKFFKANSSVPITRRKTMKDDKTAAGDPQQPKQQRKRKNMNTTIAGNLKKKRKLNDTPVGPAKQFKCDLCEYSTDTNRTLSRHMRSHNDKRLHECNICRVKFTARGNLNAHMKKHCDLFPYQCSNCRQGFMQKKPWESHENRCTAKHYVCYLCDKKFYQRRSDLSRHMRIWHTDERPYNCLECPQRYHVKHELKRHSKCHK